MHVHRPRRRAPYLPEPSAEEASAALVTVSDRTLEWRACAGRRVEVGDAEEPRWVQPMRVEAGRCQRWSLPCKSERGLQFINAIEKCEVRRDHRQRVAQCEQTLSQEKHRENQTWVRMGLLEAGAYLTVPRAETRSASHSGKLKNVASWQSTCTFSHPRAANRWRATSSSLWETRM
jgi:hypothetical protein